MKNVFKITQTHTHKKESERMVSVQSCGVSHTVWGEHHAFSEGRSGCTNFLQFLGQWQLFWSETTNGDDKYYCHSIWVFLLFPFLLGSFQFMTAVVSSSLANVSAYTLLLHALRLDLIRLIYSYVLRSTRQTTQNNRVWNTFLNYTLFFFSLHVMISPKHNKFCRHFHPRWTDI